MILVRYLELGTGTKTVTPEATTAIAVIGPGRIGRSFQRAASAAGVPTALAGRDDAAEVASGADVALLCVPDGEIESACEVVSGIASPPHFVGHTSGAGTLELLGSADRAGCEVFSLHPLQTVPDGESSLAGAPCAVSGSTPEALALARRLAEATGMRPFEIAEEARATYHAAASIASNFLVALEQSAADLLERAGVEDARSMLAPLVLQSAANWAERGSAALTGPIARGDEATVEAHLEALREHAPELVAMYEALAERTREIASAPTATGAGGEA